jgi:hypothetical protein
MYLNIASRYLLTLISAMTLAFAGKDDAEIVRLSKEATDNLQKRPELAVYACYRVTQLAKTPDSEAAKKAVQDCAPILKAPENISHTVDVAVAAAKAGESLEDAKLWCDAAVSADATKRTPCADVGKAWFDHRHDLLELEQARVKFQQKNTAEVTKSLDNLKASRFPDVVAGALALSNQVLQAGISTKVKLGNQFNALKVTDKAQQNCEGALTDNPSDLAAFNCYQNAQFDKQAADDAKALSTIHIAEAQIADGKRDTAIATLTTLLNQSLSYSVRQQAQRKLGDATTPSAVVRDALKSSWIIQLLTALMMLTVAWVGLHLLRWIWRRILSLEAGVFRFFGVRCFRIQWAFNGVQDENNKLGASDAVLDALRRVPSEVKIPIWTPDRLVLGGSAQALEVWQDFGSSPHNKPMHEEAFRPLALNQGRAADNALADAFQSLQFNVGGVGVNVAARFWRSVMDWWRDGQPGFSGFAQEVATTDGTAKQVVIRLTCSGGPYGTVTVYASTKRDDSMDVVAMTASRAAYKLLYRMSSNAETVEQIDGHAALRQGAKMLACCIRNVADSQPDPVRTADLTKAVFNLEFARQVFCHDLKHLHDYVQALRLEAIGCALLGRLASALARLEELENAASKIGDAYCAPIALEAIYNQAILHIVQAEGATDASGALLLAARLLSKIEALAPEDALAKAAAVRQAGILAALTRDKWNGLDPEYCHQIIETTQKFMEDLDTSASQLSGDDRRAYTVLASEARRNVAIASLRYIGAFELPGRGPFDKTPIAPSNGTMDHVKQCLVWFGESDAFGSSAINALVCRGYALLLDGKHHRDAEYCARQALNLDKTSEFACYVAAEACLQRQDKIAAQHYLTAFGIMPITDIALDSLNRDLNTP